MKADKRVTKSLADIPVEAVCSTCPGVVFRAEGSSHRSNREEFQKSLQEQFDGQGQVVDDRMVVRAFLPFRRPLFALWDEPSTKRKPDEK